MYFITLTLPTPKRMIKKLKGILTWDRVSIYALVGSGIIIIYFGDYPLKIFPITALMYYAVVYELIARDIIVLPYSYPYIDEVMFYQ
ncbi:MAG: hypothetical protein ACLSV2_16710 [Clostridium sp.]